jgi:hypothetical protein
MEDAHVAIPDINLYYDQEFEESKRLSFFGVRVGPHLVLSLALALCCTGDSHHALEELRLGFNFASKKGHLQQVCK